jgi:protein-tyrosine phosphatase
MKLYLIDGPWKGRLAILPRPRGDDWLDDEVRELKQQGVDIIVSLLTHDESSEFGLTREAEISETNGLHYLSFPIADLDVPQSRNEANKFLELLHRELTAGQTVALHCRQGIGRSGLIATSLLVMSGIDPEEAFRRVSAARGFSVPETQRQKDWVMELSHELARPIA